VQLHLSLGNRSKFLEAALPLLTEALEVGEATATKLDQAAQVVILLAKPDGSSGSKTAEKARWQQQGWWVERLVAVRASRACMGKGSSLCMRQEHAAGLHLLQRLRVLRSPAHTRLPLPFAPSVLMQRALLAAPCIPPGTTAPHHNLPTHSTRSFHPVADPHTLLLRPPTHPPTHPPNPTHPPPHPPTHPTHPHTPNPPTHTPNPPTCSRRGTSPRTSSRPCSAASTWHARAAGAGQQQRHPLLSRAWCSRGTPHGEFHRRKRGALLHSCRGTMRLRFWHPAGLDATAPSALLYTHNTAVWQHGATQKC
jgi:hypothetical protein